MTAVIPPPIRVLIVDDEPLIRWSMAETLTGQGCRVSEAGDGTSALQALAGGTFDVVLLDFRLPDSNDLVLFARVRALAPTAQIILVTAFGSADVCRAALDLGAYAIVSKPFAVQELADLVSHAHAARPS